MTRNFFCAFLLSLSATRVASQGLGGDFPSDFPGDVPDLDDTTIAIGNCCEAGCEPACEYIFVPLERRRNLQDSSGFPLFPLPPPGPNTDLDLYNEHCPCCRDSRCGGDPHFSTWTGDNFDFHGQCDLVLVDAPDFGEGLGLKVHIRTKIAHFYSYIESAAIQIGEDVLQISSWGEYQLNGVEGADMPNTNGAFSVTGNPNERSKKDSIFNVDLGSGQQIVVKTFKDWVSIDMKRMVEKDFKSSGGLMGGFQSGLKIGRDGHTVIEDANKFGLEWQVRPDEPMLFQSEAHPQYPQQCIMPTEAWPTRRRLGDGGITTEQASEACAHASKKQQKSCVFDVMAAQDVDFAGAY